jgi:hypothetical protein
VHQENEHSSTSGIMDVSPSSLSTKRIKTSEAVPNGRSARKVRSLIFLEKKRMMNNGINLGST